MSSLAQQQQLLIDALFAWPPENAIKNIAAYAIDPGGRGLKAYSSNGHMLAQGALQAAFPVVAQLVGEDGFSDLARAVWHGHPPKRGDLAQWGDALPDFVRNSDQLQDEPYLGDVARVEWSLHRCQFGGDVAADLASLQLLTTESPDDVCLQLAPGCAIVRSIWPIANILGAHLEGVPSFQEVGEQLRAGLAQDVVVWRDGLRPRCRAAIAGEADCLAALLDGQSLGQALETSGTLSFETWLPLAVQTSLVLGASKHP
jgi:hypothetical protein